MALERELETYRRRLPELTSQEGKFALVRLDEFDVFDTYGDALKEGYRRFGLEPFMVKQVRQFGHAQLITRLLVPQPV